MFEFQPFTQAEIAADPRIAALLADKRHFIATLIDLATHGNTLVRGLVEAALLEQEATERQREAAHYAAVQAENVRRGWRPATWREILGEPNYMPPEPISASDRCCHLWTRHREGWSCSSGWKCPLLNDAAERKPDSD